MKVIQVGIGGMGNRWIQAVHDSSEVEFAGFVEVSPQVAQQQAQSYGLDPALIFTSLPEALAAVSAQGIINVTPPQFHREVSVIALEAGIPVLSEKPLAGTREDALAIVQKANDTGILHMVTQNYRYSPLAQTVKRVLDSGELGVVAAVDVAFYKGPHFGGFREEMPHPLIVDMSIHHFDMMRFFLGSNPKRISASSWNPSWSWYKGDASASVEALFQNGVSVSYRGSWCSQALETPWNGHWRFECEKGVLRVENDIVSLQRWTGIEDRPGHRHVSNAPVEVVPFVEMPLIQQDYLLHEFYQAVSTGKAPQTTAQDNLHTVNFVFDIVHACDTGEIVTL